MVCDLYVNKAVTKEVRAEYCKRWSKQRETSHVTYPVQMNADHTSSTTVTTNHSSPHFRTAHSKNCQGVRKLKKRNLPILMDQKDEDRK